MYLLFAGVAIFAAWRWGDWRQWEKYHSTILYMIAADLLYRVLTYQHVLWEYQPAFFPRSTFVQIFIACTVYPSTVILYLSCMPIRLVYQIRHFLSWVAVYSVAEWIAYTLGLLTYHHGWNFYWSVFFNFIMFSMVWLHHKKPLVAYFISAIIAVTLLLTFQVPLSAIK